MYIYIHIRIHMYIHTYIAYYILVLLFTQNEIKMFVGENQIA